MTRRSFFTVILTTMVAMLSGCGAEEGSEKQARQFFESEFQKWIDGEESQVSTMLSGIYKPPLKYEIKSVAKDEPDFGAAAATAEQGDLPDDWKSWPAYRFNVTIEWESEAGTPLEKVKRYTITWNPVEQKWFAEERFL